jgi:hypothetical protein
MDGGQHIARCAVVEVAAADERTRVVADRQPGLGDVSLGAVVGCARAVILTLGPTRSERPVHNLAADHRRDRPDLPDLVDRNR